MTASDTTRETKPARMSKLSASTTTMMISMAVIAWTIPNLEICHGLCPKTLSSRTTLPFGSLSSSCASSSSSSLLMASPTLGESSNENYSGSSSISRSRQRDREAKTLYDYLGASPKDTQEQLKIRYTTLVRTLHPDSNPDRDTQNSYYNLSDINAAWEVLKDPVERRKYDRSLQAKEIAEGIETFVSMGIQAFETTAIPWMKKTADSTAAAVDASTKKAQEVNEQARSAYSVFELEQQSKALEQKANSETTRASKLEKELAALSTKTIASLEKGSRDQQLLSSAEAQKILRGFPDAKPPRGISNDLNIFADTELKQRDAVKACLSTERGTQQATRRVEQALKAEEMALQRLEEAQRAFDDARRSYAAAMDEEKDARNEERLAFQVSSKLETTLDRIRDKVRGGLLQQQGLFLDRRAKEIRAEISDCEISAFKYRNEAQALKTRAREKARED